MKKILPILAVTVLIVLAGCSTAGSSYAANPAIVEEPIAEENSYAVQSVEKVEVNRTINVTEDQDYRVNLTNWATAYSKQSETQLSNNTNTTVPSVAFFALLSTPSVDVAGQELNPIASQSPGDLINRVTEQNEQVSVNEKVGEQNVTHARTGQDLTVEKYDAEFMIQGQTIDGYVMTTIVNTDGGIVVAVGAYPEVVDEEDAMIEMMQNIKTQEEPPETASDSE